MAYISVTEYAKKVGKDGSRIRRKIYNGSLPAMQIGGVWIIDENTPYTDERKNKAKKEDKRKGK
jgi:ribosomal protein S24E